MLKKKKAKKEQNEEIETLTLDDEIITPVEEKEVKSSEKKKKEKKQKVKKEKIKKEKKQKNKKEKVKKEKKVKEPKEKKISKKTIIILIVIFMLLLIGGVVAFFLLQKPVEQEEEIVTVDPLDVTEKYSFSFIGVGDALLHTGVWMDSVTNQRDANGYTVYNFNHMFGHVAEAIKDYDLKFYNQETIIGGKNLGLSSYPCFNSPDEIGLDLINMGFNIVNLASNHTMDKGIRGATYSANFWHTKENILAVGSYRSFEERNNIEIREMNGITYAMLSYTYGTNGIAVPRGYEYLVNVWPVENHAAYEAYKAQVKADVEQVRDKVDVLMVSMHWGTEYQVGRYNNYQLDAATYLASLGVDVIVGTHPHVVQPIEFIDDTLVIYSLGNLVSGQVGLQKLIGGIAAFTVNKTVNGDEVDIEITDVKADLLYTYYVNFRRYNIIPFPKLNDTLLYNYRSIYEQYKAYLNPKGDSRIQVGFLE